jgi:hypothetical protein
VNVDALPIQALVLFEFENNSSLSFDELKSRIGIEDVKLREVLAFWERKSVLYEYPQSTFSVIETRMSETTNFVEEMDMEVEALESLDLTPLLPFVVGILTNLGAMDGEAIFNMISALPIPLSYTLMDLCDFLNQLDNVELSNGLYSLK